ncbi:MAG TPA: DUF2807 domain-containing protein, partial [Caulobacteraceae bacterium]|nr:DUF2807 domain-containing protein [Caulobacteraceae bacterium]
RDYANVDWNSATITKDMNWSGDGDIEINLPAEVTIIQADQPKMVITGPSDVVNHVIVDGGEIGFGHDGHGHVNVRGVHGLDDLHRLKIEISANGLHTIRSRVASKLHLAGVKSDDLKLTVNTASDADGALDVDRLELTVNTGADTSLSGRADELEVTVNTGADARLDRLAVKRATVHANTGASVIVAPTDSLETHVNTGARVIVRGRPKDLDTHMNTGGSLHFEDAGPAESAPSANAPSVSPSPSPSPSPKAKSKT